MLQVAIEAALEAGNFLKRNVGKIRHIEHKGGQETNLVTEIDKKSEQLIITKFNTTSRTTISRRGVRLRRGEIRVSLDYRSVRRDGELRSCAPDLQRVHRLGV